MKIQTAITQMLNIDLPILAAPMFLVSYPKLVAAVSEAGGMGCFPSMNYRTVEELKDALQEIRERTSKPIGVNIILYKEHNPDWARQLEVCLDQKVELLITSLGTPRTVVKEAKSTGARVFCDVTTLKHAKIVAKAGADALIAVSQGAGGHAGSISPFSLIPYLKDETDLPVLAGGSVGNGAQMAAAMALGADAVYSGTRFIASEESAASNEYKQMVVESQPEEVVYTAEVSGIPANWLKRSLDRLDSDQLQKQGHDMAAEYKRWRDIWSAGHGIAQIKKIEKAADIIRQMVEEYRQVKNNLPAVD